MNLEAIYTVDVNSRCPASKLTNEGERYSEPAEQPMRVHLALTAPIYKGIENEELSLFFFSKNVSFFLASLSLEVRGWWGTPRGGFGVLEAFLRSSPLAIDSILWGTRGEMISCFLRGSFVAFFIVFFLEVLVVI